MEIEAAAGGAGGSWYLLLEGLARIVGGLRPDIRIAVVEGGGVMNHARVGSGQLPMAILNPPMTAAALAGREPFSRPFPGLRVALTNLTVNHLQLMVDARLDLRSLDEWPARRLPLRIPVDRVGTVDRLVFDLALAHLGIRPDAITTWGGGLVMAANYHEQLRLYREGAVDALWQFMGIPSPSIEEAHRLRPLRAVGLPGSLIARLATLGWSPAELPIGAYGTVTAPVLTVAMATSIGFHAGVSADAVHAITAAVCDHPDRVRAIHEAAADFDPRHAAENAGGPLHDGAARYFRTRGILA